MSLHCWNVAPTVLLSGPRGAGRSFMRGFLPGARTASTQHNTNGGVFSRAERETTCQAGKAGEATRPGGSNYAARFSTETGINATARWTGDLALHLAIMSITSFPYLRAAQMTRRIYRRCARGITRPRADVKAPQGVVIRFVGHPNGTLAIVRSA